MKKQFTYDSQKDWELPSKHTIFLARMAGVLMVLLTIGNFLPPGSEVDLYEIIIGILTIAFGLFQFFFPLKMLKPKETIREFIQIDNEIIRWKQRPYDSVVELKIEEIEDLIVYIGEIHFKTKDGSLHKFKSHKISNKKKHEEFIEIMNTWFKDRIKKEA